jgi:hypothetical protein
VTLPRPEDLHTTDQAAQVLEVSPALIRKWRHTGKAMPAGMVRAAVPGGLQPLWKLAELRPLAERYHDHHRRRHAGQARL